MGLFDELASDIGSAVTGGGGGFGGGRGPPPEVPLPWQPRWDGDAGRWVFVNQETGEWRWDAEGLQVGEWFFSLFVCLACFWWGFGKGPLEFEDWADERLKGMRGVMRRTAWIIAGITTCKMLSTRRRTRLDGLGGR